MYERKNKTMYTCIKKQPIKDVRLMTIGGFHGPLHSTLAAWAGQDTYVVRKEGRFL